MSTDHLKPTWAPDLEASHGKAWEIKPDDIMPGSATLCLWVVEADWAHPLWGCYLITFVHLRPMANIGAPVIHLPGATHELTVAALDPRKAVFRDQVPSFMLPLNFAAQMIYDDDEEALHRAEMTVQEIIEGRLSPDTDARRFWATRFNDSMCR